MESCNGLDDDCDGEDDEEAADAQGECDTGGPGPCGPGSLACEGGDVVCEVDLGEFLCDPAGDFFCDQQANLTPCVDPDNGVALDLCMSGNCIGPGGCASAACNLGTAYFPMPSPGRVFEVVDGAADGPAAERVVRDPTTGLEWPAQGQIYDDPDPPPATAAAALCEALELAGHLDWRLPSVHELLTIVDHTVPYPSVVAAPFERASILDGDPYATSSNLAGGPDMGWVIDLWRGTVNTSPTAWGTEVLCVRGTPSPAEDVRFSLVEGEDVVHDALSGLEWRIPAGNQPSRTWGNAQRFCALEAGDPGAWRLPEVWELSFLTTTRGFNPCIGRSSSASTGRTRRRACAPESIGASC